MSGIARASGLVAGITAASRALGLARWLAFSGAVGAGAVGTAYSSANSVPNVLYEIAAGGALAAAVVPLVGAALARGRHDDVDRITSALLTWSVVVLAPLAVVLWLLARPAAGLLVPVAGAERAATVDLTATMLRWFAPQVPLYGIGIVCTGVLQAHRRFTAAALAPLLSSVVVIATYLGYGWLRASVDAPGHAAVTVLAAGTTLGVAVLSLPLVIPLRGAGVRLRPCLRLPDGAAGRVRSLAGAGVLALLAQQLAVLTTIRVANTGPGDGALNVYQYSQAVYLLPYAVLAVPVATAVFPDLAQGAELDVDTAAPRLAAALRVVAVACGLGAAGLAGAAGALGRFFGAVDAGRHASSGIHVAPAMTALVLALTPGLLGHGLAALLTRALYVRGRPRTASLWVGSGWLVAAVVPLAIATAVPDPARRLLVVGAAGSLGTTLAAVGLVMAVRGAWPRTATHGLARSVAAAAAGAVAGGTAGLLLDGVLEPSTHGAGSAALAGIACGAVALVLATVVGATVDRTAVDAVATRIGHSRP